MPPLCLAMQDPGAGPSPRTAADMCAYCSKGKLSMLSCWKLRKDIRSCELSRGQPDPFVLGAIPSRRYTYYFPTASAVEAVTQHNSSFPTASEPAAFQTLRAPSSVSCADILLDTEATHDMVNCASHLHSSRHCTSHARLADRTVASVLGVGDHDIYLRNEHGRVHKFSNVMLIPTLQANLISLLAADIRSLELSCVATCASAHTPSSPHPCMLRPSP
jgi:hypothetical protein